MKKRISVTLPIAIIFIGIYISLSDPTSAIRWLLQYIDDGCDWDTQELSNYLGVIFPDDATEVAISSNVCGAFFVDLSFKAPSQSAMLFANGICNGVLHAGYNPFNAIIDFNSSEAILIDLRGYSYYSYSPDTRTTLSGNICSSARGHYYRILIDSVNPQFYIVRFNIPFTCNSGESPIPCANGFGTPVWTPVASTTP